MVLLMSGLQRSVIWMILHMTAPVLIGRQSEAFTSG